MADETTTTTTDDGQSQQPDTGQPAEDTQRDADTLGDPGKKALDEERKARRAADKTVKDLQARLQQFEDANKSETDKLNDRATAAEQKANETHARYVTLVKQQAITAAAAAAGTTDAETVALYMDGAVEVDDDGNVTGLDKALKDLQARKPHLFRTTPAGARDAGALGTPPALNSTELEDALRRAVGAS